MALYNFTGFETGDTQEALATAGAAVGVQSSIKRTGTYALRIHPAAQNTQYYSIGGVDTTGDKNQPPNTTTYFTVYIYVATMPSANSRIAGCGIGSGTQTVDVFLSNAGVLTIVGATTSPTIATLSTGTWYRIDLTAVKNSTSSCSVDGGTAQTCTAANVNPEDFKCGNRLGTNYTYDIYYDDFAVSDTALPGAGQCNLLTPTGAGTDATGWTGGTGSTYTEVDDVPHDSDTTYWKSSAAADVRGVSFNSTYAAGCLNTIGAIKAMSVIRAEGATVDSMNLRVRSGGSTSDTTNKDPGTTYIDSEAVKATDPATASAWTIGGADAVQVAVKTNNATAVRCTALMATVWSSGLAQSLPDTGFKTRLRISVGL